MAHLDTRKIFVFLKIYTSYDNFEMVARCVEYYDQRLTD